MHPIRADPRRNPRSPLGYEGERLEPAGEEAFRKGSRVSIAAPMAELLLSCRDLTLAFDARPVFRDLGFGIFEGDRVGLVGPNGSGKSSLLRILAGREAASSGTTSARRRLRVGYVEQSPGFAPGETVRSALEAAVAGEGL